MSGKDTTIDLLAELREQRAQLLAAAKVIENEMADSSDKLGRLEEKLEKCEREILEILRGLIEEVKDEDTSQLYGHAVAIDQQPVISGNALSGGEE